MNIGNVYIDVGPFTFRLLPDGDDPGVGAVRLQVERDIMASTPFTVTRVDWDLFVKAAAG